MGHGKIRFAILTLAISLLEFGRPCLAQSATDIVEATEVICAIEYRHFNAPTTRGGITCSPESPGNDFFFLSGGWFETIIGSPDCNCDFDIDGLLGCEEVLLCLDSMDNDVDNDCLGDGLEILLGLDPLNPDTDGDDVIDGEDDADTNGIPDGEDDFDQDGLTNCLETTIGINPTALDTDGDGFPDGAEVDVDGTALSDPLDPESTPTLRLPPVFRNPIQTF